MRNGDGSTVLSLLVANALHDSIRFISCVQFNVVGTILCVCNNSSMDTTSLAIAGFNKKFFHRWLLLDSTKVLSSLAIAGFNKNSFFLLQGYFICFGLPLSPCSYLLPTCTSWMMDTPHRLTISWLPWVLISSQSLLYYGVPYVMHVLVAFFWSQVNASSFRFS